MLFLSAYIPHVCITKELFSFKTFKHFLCNALYMSFVLLIYIDNHLLYPASDSFPYCKHTMEFSHEPEAISGKNRRNTETSRGKWPGRGRTLGECRLRTVRGKKEECKNLPPREEEQGEERRSSGIEAGKAGAEKEGGFGEKIGRNVKGQQEKDTGRKAAIQGEREHGGCRGKGKILEVILVDSD